MTFWDFANAHPVAACFMVLFVFFSIDSAAVSIANAIRKRGGEP